MVEEFVEGKFIKKIGNYYWWRNRTNDLYGTDIDSNILIKIIRRGNILYTHERSILRSLKYEFNKNKDLDAIMSIRLDLILDELLNNFNEKFNIELLFNKGIKSISTEDYDYTDTNTLKVKGDVDIKELTKYSKSDIYSYLESGILLDFTDKDLNYRGRLETIMNRLSRLLERIIFITRTITSGRIIGGTIYELLRDNTEITKDHIISILNGVISSELSFTRKEIEDTINNL